MPKANENAQQKKFKEAVQLLNEAAREKKGEIENLLGEKYENIREAIEGYLKGLRKHGDPVPPSIQEEIIEVAG